MEKGIDAIAIWIRRRIRAVTTPAIKLTLDVWCLVRTVGVHVHVDLNAGETAHSLRFATGPPLVGSATGVAVEATRAVIWATIWCDPRIDRFRRALPIDAKFTCLTLVCGCSRSGHRRHTFVARLEGVDARFCADEKEPVCPVHIIGVEGPTSIEVSASCNEAFLCAIQYP